MMDSTRKIWLDEPRLNRMLKALAFLISPVLGIFAAIFHPNTKSSYVILFLSFVTLGLAIDIPEERTDSMNFDSITYRNQFEDFVSISSNDFRSVISDYSQMDVNGSTDIYSRTVYYFVSRITDDYHVCFMVIALVFTIFMLKSLRYLVSEQNYSLSVVCLLLLFLFTLSQIQKINAFRFYTAYWIAIYALFRIIVDKDRRYLFLLAVTPAVHASFFLLLGIYVLYMVMRDRQTLSVSIVVFAMLFSSVAAATFGWLTAHLPESLSIHYSGYLNEWYMREINEDGTGYKWIVRMFEALLRISVNAVGLFFAYKYRTHIIDTKCKNLYFFMLAVLAFADFTFIIPSVGSRFMMFLYPMIAYIWLVCFIKEKRYNWLITSFAGIYLLFFFCLPWNIYQLPCFNYYIMLWKADILYQSPVFLWIKYLFL